MDIAPLGFSVDTGGLTQGSQAADELKGKLEGVADATDKVADASSKMSDKGKDAAARLKEHTSAVDAHADAVKKATAAHVDHAKALDTTIAKTKEAQAADAARIAAMVQTSLAKPSVIPGLMPDSSFDTSGGALPKIGAMVPRSASALEFQAAFASATKPQPDKFDLAKMAAVSAALDRQAAAVEKMSKVADPAAAKIEKLNKLIEDAGKAADAGAISHSRYQHILDTSGAQIDRIERGPQPRGFNPIFQGLRAGFQGIPGFGRIGTALAGEDVAGKGLGDMLKLGAIGAAGLIAAEGIRRVIDTVAKLPGEMAKASDEAAQLELRFKGLGESKPGEFIDKMRASANALGTDFGQLTAEVERLDLTFTRFKSNRDQDLKINEAVVTMGRVSGLTRQQSEQEVGQVAPLFNKNIITPGELQEIDAQMHGSIDRLAGAMGMTKADLYAMAAAAKLPGAAFADAWLKVLPQIKREAAGIPETQEDAANRINTSYANMMEALDKQFNSSGFFSFIRGKNAEANNWIAENAALIGISLGIAAPAIVATPKPKPALGPPVALLGEDGRPLDLAAHPRRTDRVGHQLGNTDVEGLLGDKSLLEYQKYNQIGVTREDATQDARQISAMIGRGKALLGSPMTADQRKLLTDDISTWQREYEEALRQAQGMVTPYERLTKEVRGLSEAMKQGGGGLTTMWREATQEAENQRRTAGSALKTEQDFLQLLQLRTRIEAEQEMSDKARTGSFQERLATGVLTAGPTGDRLRLDAETEAATWAFQKFGDAVKENDDIVKRYADSLYLLKLRQRDLSDATEAEATQRTTAQRRAETMAIMGGASPAEAHLRALELRSAQDAAIRTSSGVAGSGPHTYTMPAVPGLSGATMGSLTAPTAGYRKLMYDTARGAGVRSDVGMAAFLGNIQWESGFNPDAVGPGGDFGFAQWTGVRKRALFDYAKSVGRPASDPAVQAAFLKREMMSTGLVGRLNSAGSLEDGNQMMMASERPKDWQTATGGGRAGRLAYARGFLHNLTTTPPDGIARPEEQVSVGGYAGRPAGLSAAAQAKIEADRQADQEAEDDRYARLHYSTLLSTSQATRRAASDGSPRALRALDLQFRIEGAQAENPMHRAEIPAEMRAADAATEAADAKKALGDAHARNDELARERSLLRYSGDELKVQQAVLQQKNKLIAEGRDLTDAQWKAVLRETEALTRQEVRWREQEDRINDLKDAWGQFAQDGISKPLIDAFDQSFKHGADAGKLFLQEMGDAALGLLDRLLKSFVMDPVVKAVTQIGQNFIASLLGGGSNPWGAGTIGSNPTGGAIGMALGGAFDRGSLVPFAQGDIFGGPTRFPMAGGRTGMLGEAGYPEAIMPLKRGADGRLGVAGGGGGGGNTNVQVIDMRGSKNAAPVEVQTRQTSDGLRDVRVFVRDEVKAGMRRGDYDVDQRNQFGVSRVVARR